MAEPALSPPMPSGSACDPRWRADLEALLALDERSLPSSDGLPMSDSDTQRPFLTYSLDAIKLLFADRPDIYVSGDLLVYYIGSNEFGKPVRGQVGPDVLAVIGVEDRPRDSYVMWREGPPPSFVMEIASNRTWKRDRNEKRAIYQAMGVKEYFLYDPRQNYRPPRLLGLRLYRGTYREIPSSRMPNDENGVESATLGLYAHVDSRRAGCAGSTPPPASTCAPTTNRTANAGKRKRPGTGVRTTATRRGSGTEAAPCGTSRVTRAPLVSLEYWRRNTATAGRRRARRSTAPIA